MKNNHLYLIRQIRSKCLKNELIEKECIIVKAAQILKLYENGKIDENESNNFVTPNYSNELALHTQQQLFRFHFNEFTDQIQQLKRQLNEKETELIAQRRQFTELMVICNALHILINTETIPCCCCAIFEPLLFSNFVVVVVTLE